MPIPIKKTIGDISSVKKPVFVTWAHKKPKNIFKEYCNISRDMFKENLTIIIDDVTPILMEDRKKEDQYYVTNLYRNFFEKEGCETVIYSEKFDMLDYLKLSSNTKFSRFVHYLPSIKNDKDASSYVEVLHFLNNMYSYHLGTLYGDVFLLGENVLGRFLAFREISKKTYHKDVKGIVVGFIKKE